MHVTVFFLQLNSEMPHRKQLFGTRSSTMREQNGAGPFTPPPHFQCRAWAAFALSCMCIALICSTLKSERTSLLSIKHSHVSTEEAMKQIQAMLWSATSTQGAARPTLSAAPLVCSPLTEQQKWQFALTGRAPKRDCRTTPVLEANGGSMAEPIEPPQHLLAETVHFTPSLSESKSPGDVKFFIATVSNAASWLQNSSHPPTARPPAEIERGRPLKRKTTRAVPVPRPIYPAPSPSSAHAALLKQMALKKVEEDRWCELDAADCVMEIHQAEEEASTLEHALSLPQQRVRMQTVHHAFVGTEASAAKAVVDSGSEITASLPLPMRARGQEEAGAKQEPVKPLLSSHSPAIHLWTLAGMHLAEGHDSTTSEQGEANRKQEEVKKAQEHEVLRQGQVHQAEQLRKEAEAAAAAAAAAAGKRIEKGMHEIGHTAKVAEQRRHELLQEEEQEQIEAERISVDRKLDERRLQAEDYEEQLKVEAQKKEEVRGDQQIKSIDREAQESAPKLPGTHVSRSAVGWLASVREIGQGQGGRDGEGEGVARLGNAAGKGVTQGHSVYPHMYPGWATTLRSDFEYQFRRETAMEQEQLTAERHQVSFERRKLKEEERAAYQRIASLKV